MDPWITTIVTVLGKYAIDKGVELGKEHGPQALEAAKEMFKQAVERVRGQAPKGSVIAAEYEADPPTYEKPMQKALDEAVRADPQFEAKLRALFERYEAAIKAQAQSAGATYTATNRGVVVGGDNSGIIITGDDNRIEKP